MLFWEDLKTAAYFGKRGFSPVLRGGRNVHNIKLLLILTVATIVVFGFIQKIHCS
jgi:hypothetical protein